MGDWMKARYTIIKKVGTVGTQREQAGKCAYTPRKGSDSCKGCEYSADMTLYDAGCRLPRDEWQRALHGIKTGSKEGLRSGERD